MLDIMSTVKGKLIRCILLDSIPTACLKGQNCWDAQMIGGGYGVRMAGCRLKKETQRGSSAVVDSVTVVLVATQTYTLGNVHLHTQRSGYTTVTDRDGGGMNACSEDVNHRRAAVGLRPWLMEGAVIMGSRVKGQRTRLFCYFLWIYSYFN